MLEINHHNKQVNTNPILLLFLLFPSKELESCEVCIHKVICPVKPKYILPDEAIWSGSSYLQHVLDLKYMFTAGMLQLGQQDKKNVCFFFQMSNEYSDQTLWIAGCSGGIVSCTWSYK